MQDEYTAEYQEEQREQERERYRAAAARVEELEAEVMRLRGILEGVARDAELYKSLHMSEQRKVEMLLEVKGAHEKLISEWIRNP